MKTVLLAGLLMVLGTAQAVQATQFTQYRCYIVGQDPKNPNNYTVLLKAMPMIELGEQASVVLYQSEQSDASLSLDKDRNMIVSTFKSKESKLGATAFGSETSASLIDGNAKIAVHCKKN